MVSENVAAPVIILVGPTAIGKTSLSLKFARLYNCEIVSVDSMQVYRYMDIGTAKASPAERKRVQHHLIDIVNPDEPYDAVRYGRDARVAIADIHKRGKVPLLTGGTGLYLRSVLYGIFPGVPEAGNVRDKLIKQLNETGSSKLHEELQLHDIDSAEKIHKNDTQRIIRALEVYYATGKPLSQHIIEHRESSKDRGYCNTLQIGITTDRAELYKKINLRCDIMVASGLEQEVRGLLDMGYDETLSPMNSIGYRHMNNYIKGTWSKDKMIELLARDTRRYAKRQYTWFSKEKNIQWFDLNKQDKIITKTEDWLRKLL